MRGGGRGRSGARDVPETQALAAFSCFGIMISRVQFFDWMTPMGRLWPPRGVQALGAVFNQLVRSRAQLLGAVVCSK